MSVFSTATVYFLLLILSTSFCCYYLFFGDTAFIDVFFLFAVTICLLPLILLLIPNQIPFSDFRFFLSIY